VNVVLTKINTKKNQTSKHQKKKKKQQTNTRISHFRADSHYSEKLWNKKYLGFKIIPFASS
jgi:hypothetical protein